MLNSFSSLFKHLFFLYCSSSLSILFSQLGFTQNTEKYISKTSSLNQTGALELLKQANNAAQQMNRNVTVAVLDASGVTILLAKNDIVVVHDTEASRRNGLSCAHYFVCIWI